ncbi:dienelactone hydrolase family protein [Streptomyces sp. SID8352]|uniref:dienelactone hydrolase family protein n=1 Tax=Streptomyces sp. SID8352 TaxID=2690338 RepID=UPI00136F21D4|nr:dienelactone hydrolase family protein [Streptomyces sp. SID8352]MYU23003.1 dienelactone hydrolase family protein [Streptomyces sp. SID8352]
MTAVQGTPVEIGTGDGSADARLAHPADGRPRPAVLLWPDAFGPRPSLDAMADRLAGAGYTVLVPNALYRSGRAPVVELPGFIDPAARPDLLGRLRPAMRALTPEMAVRDAGAHLRWLAECPVAAGDRVAVVGYCMGAALALRTAGAFPRRVAAVAGFHGGNLATDEPDSPHLAVRDLTAEVYFGHADEDPSLPPEQRERLAAALAAARVPHHCEVYAGARHGFTQADTAAYDEAAAERHWAALLGLLGRTL